MDSLVSLLERLNIWAWWSIGGLVLIGELLTGTTYLLWPAAAAFVVGLLSLEFLGLDWPAQLAIFAALTVALVFFGDKFVRPRLKKGADSGLNDRSARLIGERVTVVAPFASGRGRVRYGDSEWSAETADGSDLGAGSVVRVVAVKGVTLTVETQAQA